MLVLGNLTQHRVVFGAIGHRTQRHIDVSIIAGSTCELVLASGHAINGIHMLGVAQMEQSPKLGVTAQDDVAAATAIAAVGAAFRDILLVAEMQRTRAAFARAAEYFDVVYKV